MEPVLLTADDDGQQFLLDHVNHFFSTDVYDVVCSLSQEDKERYFKLITDHQGVIGKLYGEGITNSLIFLPVSKNNVNNELVQQYKAWLEKQ